MLKKYYKQGILEAGCDEAGRGCLAGPVFAAAVILPEDFSNEKLNDSKQLSEKAREELRPVIEKESLAWSVASVSAKEIDEINILKASWLAMHRAIEKLSIIPEYLLIDGNRFNTYKNIPHSCIIKGDGKYLSIAAASVLAKTYRDDFMLKIDKDFPDYFWRKNKGYPTKQQREAIKKYGATKWHRKSFRLLDEQLKLEFS